MGLCFESNNVFGQGVWQEAGSPSARAELREWVLAVPVAGWDVSANSVAFGGTVRESLTVHQADGVPRERFPRTGLNRA